MAERNPTARAAYERLEAALHAVLEVEEFEGLPTEWVIVVACQRIDDEGRGVTQIGTLLPDGDSLPYHRLMGLLDFALTRCRAEISEE
ncbi:hypothetical protein GCM10010193_70660 [Kitasatospora atroaurantiaca]|uniref:Uncharacterized protein n=1 Tax=Kitasatospora atroaurantiaca TaxID=285545 RepID=A0A561ENI6_9ACTN|nr:hypothetical protein [Kitasatospora atroaurantiaca]TWE17152.1 hypothetical protein FB465_2157 [Kitasatospora atroaurantiaca]